MYEMLARVAVLLDHGGFPGGVDVGDELIDTSLVRLAGVMRRTISKGTDTYKHDRALVTSSLR